ncbi:MAG: hypothetical protein QXT45_08215 [Candidatus Bilamarchaeaceae archaeon]
MKMTRVEDVLTDGTIFSSADDSSSLGLVSIFVSDSGMMVKNDDSRIYMTHYRCRGNEQDKLLYFYATGDTIFLSEDGVSMCLEHGLD